MKDYTYYFVTYPWLEAVSVFNKKSLNITWGIPQYEINYVRKSKSHAKLINLSNPRVSIADGVSHYEFALPPSFFQSNER